MKNSLKSISTLLLFCFSIFIYTTLCNASRLFIDPTSGSDDTGNGSLGNPYKTLEKVGLILNSTHCDTIYILGSYHYGVKDEFKRWDNQNYWIYIRPYNDTNVTLNGFGSIQPNPWRAILGIQSSKYIDIKNITVTGNNTASGFRVVSDDAPTRISQYVNIMNCRANNCQRQGILVQASDVLVDNCEVDSVCLRNRFQILGNGGWDPAMGTFLNLRDSLFFQNRNVIFRNNYIHNVWGEGIALVRARNFLVENNVVKDCFSACIYADNSRYGIIRNNWISSTGDYYNICYPYGSNNCYPANGIFWAAEGSGHYAFDSIIRNIDIYNNLIVRTSAAFGWFHDEANAFYNNSYRNIKIYYNTVYNIIAWETFYLEPVTVNIAPPTGCEFKNNIIPKGRYLGIERSYFTLSQHYYQTDKWIFSNNCFIDYPIPPALPPGNNVQGNPSFINPNINIPDSFKIKGNSNCNNNGIIINGINFDYWYSGRDSITPCIGFHEFGGTSGINPINNEVPTAFSIFQNFPNPFNLSTKVKFDLPKSGSVKLVVFDAIGREVATLVNEQLKPGTYEVDWNASGYSSGVYFYWIEARGFSDIKRMMLIK